MKSTNLKRHRDALFIPEGQYFEVYTPAAGKIISPSLDKVLKYAKFCLSEDANVTFKDARGNSVAAFPLAKGEHSFLVTEISVVSAGSVAIIHDGELDSGTENE